jgi:hypothetical protein
MLVSTALGAAAVLAAAGCDGAPATPDARPEEPDAGTPFACAAPTVVDLALGETRTVMLDTSTTTSRPRDLGLFCGNWEPTVAWAPQEVIEVRVPGDGQVAVLFDAVWDETLLDFDTVLQVRRDCSRPEPGLFPETCFDDADSLEIRSRGGANAMGGETLFLYVTGFSDPPAMRMAVDRGPVRVDVTARPNTTPTITSGSLRLVVNDVQISASGFDPDGDVLGVAMNFLGPSGALLDIYGDGEATPEGDVFIVRFSPQPTETSYVGNGLVSGTRVNLAGYLRAVRASQAIFRVFDEARASSEMFSVTIM